MKAEFLGENAYKITLDKNETDTMPDDSDRYSMHRFICNIIEQIEEDDVHIPVGKLLTEIFRCSDGSCVIFITAPEQEENTPETQYYCCDIKGIDDLRALCGALALSEIYCSIYCGNSAEEYRLIFTDPHPSVCRTCAEYGELSEITWLFACQTAEYLTEIAHNCSLQSFYKLLK